MAKSIRTSVPSDSSSASSTAAQTGPLHVPFSWLHKNCRNDPNGEFAGHTLDICMGIETCLNLVVEAQLHAANNGDAEPDPDDRPLLSLADTERLLRLALVSPNLLAKEAERRIDVLNNAGRK